MLIDKGFALEVWSLAVVQATRLTAPIRRYQVAFP